MKKNKKKNKQSVAQRRAQKPATGNPLLTEGQKVTVQSKRQKMVNNSAQVKQLKVIQDMADNRARGKGVIQKKENKTGLPNQLKSGVENLSGIAMDDVKVHYNSSKPAQLNAHAYAQGTNIHLGPGQEKHLPHEAWHVVQQKQGRVRPTMQMKGKVNINDDRGLEREADVMGNKALQAKKNSTASTKHKPSGSIVQRVEDEGVRKETDIRTDELYEQTKKILMVLEKEGEDWEKIYGEKGKEKGEEMAKDKLSGKKSEDPKTVILKKIMKEYWASLSTEEKIEMVGEAASLGMKAAKLLGRAGKEAVGSVSLSSGGSKEKAKKEPKEPKETSRKSVLTPSVSWINELTANDVERLYDVYKARKKVNKEIEKIKAQVVKSAGEVGESVGSAVGKERAEYEFNQLMSKHRQNFIVARKRYQLLEAAIASNKDKARYKNEMDALHYALFSINGPAMVYFLGELNEQGRQKYPGICKEALAHLEQNHPRVRGGIVGGLSILKEKVVGAKAPEMAKLTQAQDEMALTLRQVTGKSWSKYTKYGWTPTSVKSIRKVVTQSSTAVKRLTEAKQIAEAATKQTSGNRFPETQIFYDAIAGLKIEDLSSLKTSTSILKEVGAKLG